MKVSKQLYKQWTVVGIRNNQKNKAIPLSRSFLRKYPIPTESKKELQRQMAANYSITW